MLSLEQRKKRCKLHRFLSKSPYCKFVDNNIAEISIADGFIFALSFDFEDERGIRWGWKYGQFTKLDRLPHCINIDCLFVLLNYVAGDTITFWNTQYYVWRDSGKIFEGCYCFPTSPAVFLV